MCSYGDDYPAIWRDSDVKARKPHQCSECNRTIEPGETYRKATMLFEGRWDTYATCVHCRSGQLWLIRECGGFMHMGLAEEMQEHIEEYPELWLGLGRIRLGMRRKWKRFGSAGLMKIPPVAGAPKYARAA